MLSGKYILFVITHMYHICKNKLTPPSIWKEMVNAN